MKLSFIICAAGKGVRAGFRQNKLLYPFHGANALYYAVERVKAFSLLSAQTGDNTAEILVTSSEEDYAEISALCSSLGCDTVIGGDSRSASVYNALKRVTGDIVFIHDGARPFATAEQFLSCLECVKKYGSAVTALPATDTIAVVKDGWIADIPRRNELFALQTPQAFITRDIKSAYEKALKSGEVFTDDSSIYSRYISPARICECGSPSNKKLTYRQDFESPDGKKLIDKFIINDGKVGFGVDVHAFGNGANYVTLCGVKVPCDRELIAHSDGDVVLHSVMDALLSAAGLYDIGHYFPDSDDTFSGADSGMLLSRVIQLLAEKGLKPRAFAIAIEAEKPRLAKYIDMMKSRLADITGVNIAEISITAGTCEGLGFVGERLGICSYCVAAVGK